MNIRTPALAIALLIVFSGSVYGQARKRAVAPEDAQANASRLITEITWKTSLADLDRDATHQGKLVFYMHMLGDIAGNT